MLGAGVKKENDGKGEQKEIKKKQLKLKRGSTITESIGDTKGTEAKKKR
jgi:hypothetical protein